MTFFSSPDLKDKSGLETITSSVQDVIIDSLQFTPKPGASYITLRRDTRFFAAGSDAHQPDTTRVAGSGQSLDLLRSDQSFVDGGCPAHHGSVGLLQSRIHSGARGVG